MLKELRGISGRITDLEKKIETIDATIRRQFTSLTPFEKQLSRLEPLYKNIDGLDKRILFTRRIFEINGRKTSSDNSIYTEPLKNK